MFLFIALYFDRDKSGNLDVAVVSSTKNVDSPFNETMDLKLTEAKFAKETI